MQEIKNLSTKFILLILCSSCIGQEKVKNPAFDTFLANFLQHSVPEITVAEINKRNDFIFLDARERQEYSISRIPTALHVGYQNFTTKVLDSIDRKKVMVVYCSIGYRSEKICEQIQKSGFKNVYNLYGGIFEWVNQGLPLHDNQKKQTNKIHAYDKKWGIWLDKGEKIY